MLAFDGIAQKETTRWLFGNRAYLNFSSGVPSSLPNASITAVEGSASIADATGNLLLYTDGQTLWNKNHQVLTSSLGGHQSSNQAALFVKKPNSSTIYYVFTTGSAPGGGLSYSIIDMSLSSGNGSITTLNVQLTDSVPEKLSGTLHCNGKDVWVVVHITNSKDFYAYLLTSTGLVNSPVISSVGTTHIPNSTGAIKISPTGKKLGVAITGLSLLEIFDFNNKTGQVSNPIVLDSYPVTQTFEVYGCEFSPDGTKFYSNGMPGNPYVQRQWDLCAGSSSAVVSSSVIIGQDTLNKFFQLAPDGKIYISRFLGAFGGGKYLSSINSPNLAGTACNFQKASTFITHGNATMGLPNFINSSLREKNTISIATSQTCGAYSFTSIASNCSTASYSISGLKWDFGDPNSFTLNTSTATVTQHEYSKNGTYTITLVAYFECYSDTVRKTVQVSGLPTMTVSGPAQVCKGESRTFTVQGATNYSWSSGGTSSTTILSPTSTSVFSVTGAASATGCSTSQMFTLTVLPCNGLVEAAEKDYMVYPNPASISLKIQINTFARVTIYNELGSLVATYELKTGGNELDISALKDGLYYLTFEGEEKYQVVKKLIKISE